MIALGALLLAAAVTYFQVIRSNNSHLDDLNASVSDPPAMPQLPPGQVEVRGTITDDGTFQPIKAVLSDINEDTTDSTNPEQISPTGVPVATVCGSCTPRPR